MSRATPWKQLVSAKRWKKWSGALLLWASACASKEERFPSSQPKNNTKAIPPVARPSTVRIPKFAFGAFDSGSPGNEDVRLLDGWVVDGFGADKADRVRKILGAGQVPMVVVSMFAKASGLQDCKAGVPPERTLCGGGANFLRNNTPRLVNAEVEAARYYAFALGDKPGLLWVEPDWARYTRQEQSAPLSAGEMGTIFSQIFTGIKDVCKTCEIIADVTAWEGGPSQNIASWNLGKVSYIGLTGKAFPSSGLEGGMTYAQLVQQLGKPLVINTGYGPGGVILNYERSWDDLTVLDQRSAEGVSLLIQPPKDVERYRGLIERYRSHTPSTFPSPSDASEPNGSGDNVGKPNGSVDTGTGVGSGPSGAGAGAPKPDAGTGSSVDAGGPGSGAVDGSWTGTADAGPPPAELPWALDVSPNINSYWLEVTVTPPSDQTVSRVEAIVNGATTIALDPTSWGTYAKNQRVDSGATVIFRAWDSQGKSHDSKPVKWP